MCVYLSQEAQAVTARTENAFRHSTSQAELESPIRLNSAFRRFWAHPQRDRWLWFGFLLVGAAYYYFHFGKYTGGLTLYRHAAKCLWNHQVLLACETGFTYPPAFAFLMLPFAAMPMWLATLIWYAITLFCTVWCCWLCEDLTERMFPGQWLAREREWLRFFGISSA
jgi:hypothetical protein